MGKRDYCIVPGCGHMPRKGALCKFMRFPTKKRDRQSREKWIKAIGKPDIVLDPVTGESIPWEPKPNTMICTCHWDTPPDTRSRRLFTKTVAPHIFPDPEMVKAMPRKKPGPKPKKKRVEEPSQEMECGVGDEHDGDMPSRTTATKLPNHSHKSNNQGKECTAQPPVAASFKHVKKCKRKKLTKVCLFCFTATNYYCHIENVKLHDLPIKDLIHKYGNLNIQTGTICGTCMSKLITLHKRYMEFSKQCERIKTQIVGGNKFVAFKCRRTSPTNKSVEFIPVKAKSFPKELETPEEVAARALTSIASKARKQASLHHQHSEQTSKSPKTKEMSYTYGDTSRTESGTDTAGVSVKHQHLGAVPIGTNSKETFVGDSPRTKSREMRVSDCSKTKVEQTEFVTGTPRTGSVTETACYRNLPVEEVPTGGVPVGQNPVGHAQLDISQLIGSQLDPSQIEAVYVFS